MPSPNYAAGRMFPISMIIIHSTRGGQVEGVEMQATINWFLNPDSEASSHIVIGKDGRTIRFVNDEDQCWAAGELNAFSLQVELEQPDNETEFTRVQIDNLVTVVQEWMAKYSIPITSVLGHDQTSQGIAQGKTDVGKMFDWIWFRERISDD